MKKHTNGHYCKGSKGHIASARAERKRGNHNGGCVGNRTRTDLKPGHRLHGGAHVQYRPTMAKGGW